MLHSKININIISPEQWLEIMESENFLLVDVRRLIEYKMGHIPYAVSMPFMNFVKMHGLALYPPDEKEIIGKLSMLGITKNVNVVCYDNFYGRHACRALYTLELLGYEKLSALSVTFDKYFQLGYPVEKQIRIPSRPTSLLNINYSTENIITKEKILKVLNREDEAVLIDTRNVNDYLFGHIPGALNLPWHEVVSSNNLYNLDNVLKFVEETGIDKDTPIIFYCEEGTSSSLVMYAFRALGYKSTQTYLPSFSEWISYPNLPIERNMR